jgi:diadenosine tetraphosphatase ApaH/serine/threonine PP2A family protein phosphatase
LLALISDIHSNLAALEAVLADIKAQGAERIYCLGDVIGYGPQPRECIDLAAQWEFCLMGNHDYAVFLEPTGFNTAAERAVFWTREALDAEPASEARLRRWEFLADLGVHKFEDNVLFVHGSPRRPLHEYIFPDDPQMNMEKMAAIFDRIPSACFVGHTHMPGVFTEDYRFLVPAELDHHMELGERRVVINIGSVGQSRDRDPRACYVLLDGKRVVWRRVEYDVQATARAILEAPGLDNFNALRLRDGR